MAIANPVNAAEMARRFSEVVKAEPAIRQLWIRQTGNVAEFWILTDPIDIVMERRLRSIRWLFFETFPGTLFEFHLINSRLSEELDSSGLIPGDAKLFIMH